MLGGVFARVQTFGLPDPLDPYCGAPCAYNATTRTAFWGFVSARSGRVWSGLVCVLQ